jgi:hypothetical protein
MNLLPIQALAVRRPTKRCVADRRRIFHNADFAFRPTDFATLTSRQMRPVTSSSTRCTSVDDYHMSVPRIELGSSMTALGH